MFWSTKCQTVCINRRLLLCRFLLYSFNSNVIDHGKVKGTKTLPLLELTPKHFTQWWDVLHRKSWHKHPLKIHKSDNLLEKSEKRIQKTVAWKWGQIAQVSQPLLFFDSYCIFLWPFNKTAQQWQDELLLWGWCLPIALLPLLPEWFMGSTHSGQSTRDFNVGVRRRITYFGFYEAAFSISSKLDSIHLSQKM